MTTSITKFLFVIPALIFIYCLAMRFVEPSGPIVDLWISQIEFKHCLSSIDNKDWIQAGLHLSRVLTAEGYLLAALFFSFLLGVKHYFNASKKPLRTKDLELNPLQNNGNRLGNMGLACSESGQIEKAIGYYEQAMAVAYQTNDHQVAGNTLGNLGNAYQALGEVEKAVRYHKKALVIFRKIGDRQGEGCVLGNIGKVYSACGQVEKAIKYNKQSLMIFEAINSPHAIPMRQWLSELENRGKRESV